jgi:hypothetical protein
MNTSDDAIHELCYGLRYVVVTGHPRIAGTSP